jgi:transcriptional regulator with XRE-family HTH domain
MAKLSQTRRKAKGITLTPQTGRWIKSQLVLKDIRIEAVARKAGLHASSVTHFLHGRKPTPAVKPVLAELLGYASFEAMIAASRGKGAAV